MKSRLLCLVPAVLLIGVQAGLSNTVVVYGNNVPGDIATFLNNNGQTATSLGATAPTAGQLSGVDTVIALRSSINPAIVNFVNAGGLLITEWDASVSTLNTFSLISANDSGGGYVGTGTPVTFTAAGLAAGLGDTVGASYSDGPRTEFFRTLTGIGSGVDVLATRPGSIPAIIGGASGSGSVLIIGYDWADGFGSGANNSGLVLLDALNYNAAGVPDTNSTCLALLFGLGIMFTFRRFAVVTASQT